MCANYSFFLIFFLAFKLPTIIQFYNLYSLLLHCRQRVLQICNKRVFHYCAIISLGYGLFIVLTLFLLFDVFSSLFKSLCSVLLQLTCRYCHNELKTFCFLFCTGEKSGHEVLKVGFVDDDLAVVHILQDVVEGDMTVELSCSFTVCFFEGLILLLIYWSR